MPYRRVQSVRALSFLPAIVQGCSSLPCNHRSVVNKGGIVLCSSFFPSMATTASISGDGQEEEEEEELGVRSPYFPAPFDIPRLQQERLWQKWDQQAGQEELEAQPGEEDYQVIEQDWTIGRRGRPLGFGVIIREPSREEQEGEGEGRNIDSDDDGDGDLRLPTNPPLSAIMRAVDDPRRTIETAQVMRERGRAEQMRNRLENGGGGAGGQGGRMDWRIGAEEQVRGERNGLASGGGGEGGLEGRALALVRKLRVGVHQGSMTVNHTGEGKLATTMMMARDYSSSCKLPDHLIESVLARLPVQSVFRFRSVCKAWNSLLYSPTFLMAYSETTIRHNVWFLVVTANLGRLGRYGHRIVATYDPQCNNWHRIPLPAPLSNLNPYPTAADGGLVCYFVYDNRLRTLFVCNPLTKSLRKLPLVLKTSSHISVLKMVMEDRATSSYKVFVAGMVPGENGNDSLSMEVYDSATDCWSTGGIIPARYPKKRPVYSNGVLYVRCSDQRSLLLTYDLKDRVWRKIHAHLPYTLGVEELVQYEGHILLVGVLGENYKIDSVCIWELVQENPRNVTWKQVDAMPRDMFMELFCDKEYFQCHEDERVFMKCCQYGDLILCVAFSTLPRGPFKVVAYDLAQRRWRRLPDSFKARECRTHKFIEGIIYEPRLDVSS